MHLPNALVGAQLADAVEPNAGVPRARSQQCAVRSQTGGRGVDLVLCAVSPWSEEIC